MQQIVLFVVGLLISISASARECRAIHRTVDPESLYLSLKIEEWKYHPIPLRSVARVLPLPDSLRDQLIREHNDKFDVAGLSPELLSRFYLNSLRSQYIQAANRWEAREVQFLTGGRQSKFAAQLLKQLIGFKSLNDRELSPESVQEIFASKEWRQFPWNKALDMVETFQTSGIEYSRSNFLEWMDHQPHGLSAREVNEIVQALDQSRWKKLPICCLSNPGCFDCPTNRRWSRSCSGGTCR